MKCSAHEEVKLLLGIAHTASINPRTRRHSTPSSDASKALGNVPLHLHRLRGTVQ